MKDPFECVACGGKFNGESLFVTHRQGQPTGEHPHYGRTCLPAGQLLERGWRLIDDIWRGPAIPEEKRWWVKTNS